MGMAFCPCSFNFVLLVEGVRAKVRADQTMLPRASGHGNGACARALDNERRLRLRAVQPTWWLVLLPIDASSETSGQWKARARRKVRALAS